MNRLRPLVMLVVAAALALPARPLASPDPGQATRQPAKKPSLSIKATPMVAFTPAKVFLTGELKGGSDDYKDLYCATIEWNWDDDTTSESSVQCEPYESGKSQIRRRFSIQHEFKMAGMYRVQLRLKKKDKIIISAYVNLQINPGIRDPGR